MAEYVNKAEVKEMAKKVISELCADDGNRVVAEINAFAGLNKLPTIDIVRCSECIHREENIKKYIPNEPLTWICKGKGVDGFCSSGERKTPPIVADEITELNEENNKLLAENKRLKEKLWKINGISSLSVLEEMKKE